MPAVAKKLRSMLACGLMLAHVQGAPLVEVQVDFSKPTGTLRALHGINKGPIAPGGLIDVTLPLQALGIPFIRLHDCHWPNPDVVDIHAIFPNFDADPDKAESYQFGLTDEYITASLKTGAALIYRLGESIEHTSVKRFVHPPKDLAKWTAICRNIIRHYNEGWANGFHHGIKHWEIWNEPENRPTMWSGTDEDYFNLYQIATTALKREFPALKFGGPAVGGSGELLNGEFKPTAFVLHFLERCRKESLPLDFFSWHCYTADPQELVVRAKTIRKLLDAHGFQSTESHLTEWNYLPGNTWKPLEKNGAPELRQRYYEDMSGAGGGAFLVSALVQLQDAPIDVCGMFHGEIGAFGLFNDYGVPCKNYEAVSLFHALLKTPLRVAVTVNQIGKLAIAAGLSEKGNEASVLICNTVEKDVEYSLQLHGLPWDSATIAETQWVNSASKITDLKTETLQKGDAIIHLKGLSPSVILVRLRPQP